MQIERSYETIDGKPLGPSVSLGDIVDAVIKINALDKRTFDNVAIVDLLRSRIPHVQTMLMDHATLLANHSSWGYEPSPVRRDLPHLTAAEQAVYDDLRDNRLRSNLRLEQELIAWHLVEAAIRNITSSQ